MGILSYAPAHLVQLIASLVGIYAITRILTPHDYGLYALVLSLMSLCQSAFFSWSDVGAKRFLERARVQDRLAVLATTIYSGLGLSTVLLLAPLLAALAAPHLAPGFLGLLAIGAGAILARQLSLVAKSFQLAALARARYLLMDCSESIIGVAAGLALCWYLHMGAAGILTGMVLGAATVIGFDIPAFVQRLRGGVLDLTLQREIIRFATPISIVFFAEYIVASADRLLVEYYLGSAQLGIYAVSYSIADRAVSSVFLALSIGSYPLVVRALERDGPEAARWQSLKYAELLVALSLPAIGGFIVVAERLAKVFAGPAFAPQAAELMPLIGTAVFLNGLRTHYFAQALHLSKRTWMILASSIPAAIVNLAANVLLLPRMGLMGAVWATIIAYTMALVITIIQMAAIFPLPFPTREAIKALVATLIVCGLLKAIPFSGTLPGLVSVVLFGIGLYGALAFILDIGELRTRLGPVVRAASEVPQRQTLPGCCLRLIRRGGARS
jgi:O-antigen/teichoic acid export membrane protein